MPLYEYRCRSCSAVVEVIQKFSDPELTDCSACGGSLEKLLAAPAIRFKGAGWYVNDYASKNSNGSSAKPEPAQKPDSTSSKPVKATEGKTAEKVT